MKTTRESVVMARPRRAAMLGGALLLTGLASSAWAEPRGGTAGTTVPAAQAAPAADSSLLPVGSVAPDFTATAVSPEAPGGKPVTLSKLRGHFVVLYFYPKDDTPGCTKEACEFRDTWGTLQKKGVHVYGVSTQDVASHKAFADKHHLPFPLIADEKGTVAAAYKVPVFLGMARRITYLIDPEGHIRRVWPSVTPIGHAADVLKTIESKP